LVGPLRVACRDEFPWSNAAAKHDNKRWLWRKRGLRKDLRNSPGSLATSPRVGRCREHWTYARDSKPRSAHFSRVAAGFGPARISCPARRGDCAPRT